MTDHEQQTALVKRYIDEHHCTDDYHTRFGSWRFTDGVRFLVQTCKAEWLLEALETPAAEDLIDNHRFLVWRLHLRNDVWILEAWDDTPEAPRDDYCPASTLFHCQEVAKLDQFPKGLADFEIWSRSNVLYLPCEH